MLRMIRIIPIPSLQLFPNLVVETGKAADDDVWGWDGSGAHVLEARRRERRKDGSVWDISNADLP